MSYEHRPLKSRSKGCARKSGLLNRTPYANHESPQFTQAFLDGIAATSTLIFAVAGVTLLFMPGPCRWVAATSTLIFVVAGAQCFVAAGLSPGRPLKTPPRSAQTRPRWLGRPLTVRVPITVAFAWCGTTKTVGNNAPGTTACQSPLPLRAAAPRKQSETMPPGTAACQSPLPLCAAAPRGANALAVAAGVSSRCQPCSDNTGAYAPRSCAAMRTSAGEKTIFRCTNAHAQERRASARRGSRNERCAVSIEH
jgi:hypothetical protein